MQAEVNCRGFANGYRDEEILFLRVAFTFDINKHDVAF